MAENAELDYITNAASEDRQKYGKRANVLEQEISFVEVKLEDLDKKRGKIVESYIEGDLIKKKQDDKLRVLDERRKEVLLERTSFRNEREHLKFLLEDIKLGYNIGDVLKITGYIERTISLEEKIAGTSDDGERSRITYRHIQEITVESRETECEFRIGKREAPARSITIGFYSGGKQYCHYLPSTGRSGVILLSTLDGLPMEEIRLEYLDHFCDGRKRRRYQKTEEKKQQERKTKYPDNEYILGYPGLARFLKVGILTAYGWTKTLDALKPVIVNIYNKRIVAGKKKCIKLLTVATEHNIWAKKIFNDVSGLYHEDENY